MRLTGRAGRAGRAGQLVVAALGSCGGAWGLSQLLWVPSPTSLAIGIFAILVIHGVFIQVLVDSLAAETKRAKLWRNIFWYVGFIVALIAIYAAIYAEVGLRDGAAGKDTNNPWLCLYFSVVTWTTLGYGDVTAVQPMARLFAAIEAFNGVVVMAIFIAVLVPSFQRMLSTPR